MLRLRNPHPTRPDAPRHQNLQQKQGDPSQHTETVESFMRPGLSHTTILLVGLGNPIMGDDAVGIHVVRMLKDRNRGRADLEFKELSLGGLGLVEEILGYERVFIIDSVASTGRLARSVNYRQSISKAQNTHRHHIPRILPQPWSSSRDLKTVRFHIRLESSQSTSPRNLFSARPLALLYREPPLN